MLTSGAAILTIVGAIISVLAVPVFAPISPDVAQGVAGGLALKLVVAMSPMLAVFLLFGFTDILLLNMAATVALAMGARGGWDMGIG